jgi:hypothetical protein
MFETQIGSLIEYLEQVKRSPRLFFQPVNDNGLHSHIHGIHVALNFFGLELDGEIYEEIEARHGWQGNTSFGAVPHMRKAGLTEERIVDEYLSMYLETWKEMLIRLEDAKKQV